MDGWGAGELMYFAGDEALLPAYGKLRAEMLRLYPSSEVRAKKSQISFRDPHPYVWVWTLAGHGSRKAGKGPLFITFASPFPIESPLIHTKLEPYPGRWTHHVAVNAPEEISEELIRLLQASHSFRNDKLR